MNAYKSLGSVMWMTQPSAFYSHRERVTVKISVLHYFSNSYCSNSDFQLDLLFSLAASHRGKFRGETEAKTVLGLK